MLSIYPFQMQIVSQVLVTHCKRGYRPRSLCTKCFADEQSLTIRVLVLATNLNLIELDSREWYLLYKNRVRGKLASKAEILVIECRRSNRVPCARDAVKLSGWGPFKRRYAAWSRYGSPEEYSCCQEDGLPHHWWQPSGHRQRQRSISMGNPNESDPSCVPNNQYAPKEFTKPCETEPQWWVQGMLTSCPKGTKENKRSRIPCPKWLHQWWGKWVLYL